MKHIQRLIHQQSLCCYRIISSDGRRLPRQSRPPPGLRRNGRPGRDEIAGTQQHIPSVPSDEKRALKSTSTFTSHITSVSTFTSDTHFSSSHTSCRCELLKNASPKPSHHQPTTTAYLLSFRLQSSAERPLSRRPTACVRAKIIGSLIPACAMLSTVGTIEGSVR